MNELMAHLKTQCRLHKLSGANGLAKLFGAATKRIVELEKENALLKRIDQIFNQSPDLTFDICQGLFQNEFKANEIEQQAKGVRDLFTRHLPKISRGKSAVWELDDVLVDECIERLTAEAKALREQGK